MNESKKNSSDLKLIGLFFLVIFIFFILISSALLFFIKSKNIAFNKINPLEKLQKFIGELENINFEYSSDNGANFKINENTYEETTYTNEFNQTEQNDILDNEIIDKPLVEDMKSDSQNFEEDCYEYEISKPDEFRSKKCYSYSDFYQLQTYINNYNSANSSISWAKSGIDITCDDKEFFGDACDNYKESLEDAENDLDKYKVLILETIKKGK